VKVIVVDDDQEVRTIVAHFLVDAGYCVVEAENGVQALAFLTAQPALRMMISDIRMPGMSGVELAEEAARQCPTLRVILISGFADPHCLRWPLLRKPFRMSSLVDLVAREVARA
jgi:CheY-like chemotaxis protein